jgi:hypothetical protein
MLRLDPLVQNYLPRWKPKFPLPWHNHDISAQNYGGVPHDDSRPHLTTERYARLMLDALAGDDRRKDLRRVYRFQLKHGGPSGPWQVTAHHCIIEAVRRYSAILPPQVFKDYRTRIRSLKNDFNSPR